MIDAIDQATARTWFYFIRDRLEDDLQAASPVQESDAVHVYRKGRREAQQLFHQALEAIRCGDIAVADMRLEALEELASRWKTHGEHPAAVPISDGTMPCFVPGPAPGTYCTKTIPAGCSADDGHGGEHFWQSVEAATLHRGGAHYSRDLPVLLSEVPAEWHWPKDCTPDCWRWRDR
ncbi:hypothetical protein HHL19_35570 [Streptomyces sp. R302]|uniref:hypothetical protein n=1 Tax=unclassified Streptomyces TaxID=2593676 RepID=UPI00145DBC87|nr:MULTISPECIES: hypothetical protein [unclassified Streptomyces]NML55140.1 hypothetical protein [Streptomyces sp. R301]NML83830.1 hypothetical protein [Streptomyces sp. R302]